MTQITEMIVFDTDSNRMGIFNDGIYLDFGCWIRNFSLLENAQLETSPTILLAKFFDTISNSIIWPYFMRRSRDLEYQIRKFFFYEIFHMNLFQ